MRRMLLAVVMMLLLLCTTAQAGELDGITLPDTMDVGGSTLVLNGMSQRSVIWIDVYVAGLYLAEKTGDGEAALAMEGSKRMDMVFQRDVSSEDICDAWKDGFEDNTADEGVAQMPALEALCAATPELLEGDIMVYTYDATTSTTEFFYNGESKFTTEDKDFYTALLGCWIGPKPGPGKRFKKRLLKID